MKIYFKFNKKENQTLLKEGLSIKEVKFLTNGFDPSDALTIKQLGYLLGKIGEILTRG
jgi:hypothetical protein